ncbi:NYN domain-containing protein [[Limnothrix rosea] IAM M-220]|uniref:NYN domain-containing protein n=1 Tax=[Limnothrix rosea] IAM M-220 TaxID=454133 RepID=UPI000961C6A8|nr:NYN domain-containing protein [[Limnothrix rosea] IAM M-220]OKH19210.1 RNA-binding protein [[Limnothrix rosea] IAM M-220]
MKSLPASALVLVDGYNVIGAWHELKETRDRHGLEMARDELIEVLVNYASHNTYKTKIVFDAQYQKTPSHEEDYTQLLSVCYTAFSETADTYIERTCANFRRTYTIPNRIIVVTSDQAQRHTVVGYGAEWMSSLKLQTAVLAANRKSRYHHKTRQSKRGRHLLNSLDPKTQQMLRQLRHGL